MNYDVMAMRFTTVLQKRGMRQVDLARALDLPPSLINHYVKGNSMPNIETAVKLAQVLQVPVEWLFGLEDDTLNQSSFLASNLELLITIVFQQNIKRAASCFNMSEQTLSSILLKTYTPQIEELNAICEYLAISNDVLVHIDLKSRQGKKELERFCAFQRYLLTNDEQANINRKEDMEYIIKHLESLNTLALHKIKEYTQDIYAQKKYHMTSNHKLHP